MQVSCRPMVDRPTRLGSCHDQSQLRHPLSGNGIDVNSLVAAAQAPVQSEIQLYQQQQTGLQTQAGLLTSLNNDLDNLCQQ